MSLSDITDLYARDGKHSHSKVMILLATAGTFLLLLLIVAKSLTVSWPLAALIAAFLYAPFGLDTIKAIAKIRQGGAP